MAVVSIQYGEVKTNDDRLAFIRQFGYSPVSEPAESAEVIIPETFDAVYEKYNELQRAQGLNLKKYQGKSAMKYTYLLEEYPGYEGRVLFTMLVYKDKVIAGDVCGIDEAQSYTASNGNAARCLRQQRRRILIRTDGITHS